MRRFILKIIYFCIPLIILGSVLEILVRSIPNDYALKASYLEKNSSEIETLILGSSHAYYGLNPNYFESKTFNASHISQSLDYDLEILKRFESKFKNLKDIIIPISYFSLYFNIEDGDEYWRIKNYNLYYNIKKSSSITNYSAILGNEMKVSLNRIYSYYFLKKSEINCSNLGWGFGYNSNNAKNLLETGIAAAKRHTKDDLYSVENKLILKENTEILNKILEWSKKRNINVILFTPPAFNTYRNHLNSKQLKITTEKTNSICNKFNNCIYLNMINNPNFTAIDFYDADHLANIGAKKLSKKINHIIEQAKAP